MMLALEVPVSFDVAGGAVVRAGVDANNPGIAPQRAIFTTVIDTLRLFSRSGQNEKYKQVVGCPICVSLESPRASTGICV